MADTIISNTPGSRDESGMAGWLVAFVVIIALAIGGLMMYQNGFFRSDTDTNSTTNINVTVPDPITPPVTTE
jgi:hypothetical protein